MASHVMMLVVGFLAGVKFTEYILTYKFAWRECCLKHYATHKEENDRQGEATGRG